MSCEESDQAFVPMARLEWRLVATGLIALMIGVGAVAFALGPNGSPLQIYLAYVGFVGTLLFPILFARGRGGWFEPLIFTVLWWGCVRQLGQRLPLFVGGLDHHVALPGVAPEALNWLVTQGLVLQTLLLLGVYAGYGLIRRMPVPAMRFGPPTYLGFKVAAVVGLSIIAFAILYQQAGGLSGLLMQRGMDADERIINQIGGHWHFLVGLVPPACLVWLGLRQSAWRDARFWLVFGIGLILGFVVTGSRSGVVLPVLMAIVIRAIQRKQLPYALIIAAAMLGSATIGILGQFRSATQAAQSIEQVEVDIGLTTGVLKGLETFTSYAGEMSGPYAILAKVPAEHDYLWGESYLSIPVIPVPSAIWSGKPEAGGRLVAKRLFDGRSGGVPPGTMGEAYWNFGIAGVLGVGVLWGLGLRWLKEFYLANKDVDGVLPLYVLALFTFQPNSPMLYEWAHVTVPAVLLVLVVCGWKSRKQARQFQWPETRFKAPQ